MGKCRGKNVHLRGISSESMLMNTLTRFWVRLPSTCILIVIMENQSKPQSTNFKGNYQVCFRKHARLLGVVYLVFGLIYAYLAIQYRHDSNIFYICGIIPLSDFPSVCMVFLFPLNPLAFLIYSMMLECVLLTRANAIALQPSLTDDGEPIRKHVWFSEDSEVQSPSD